MVKSAYGYMFMVTLERDEAAMFYFLTYLEPYPANAPDGAATLDYETVEAKPACFLKSAKSRSFAWSLAWL